MSCRLTVCFQYCSQRVVLGCLGSRHRGDPGGACSVHLRSGLPAVILWTLAEGRRLGSEARDAQHSQQPESLLSTLLQAPRLWGAMRGAPRAHRQLQ